MQGISIDELYENIINSHDIEFIYNNKIFVIQTEIDDNNAFLVIWNCDQNFSKCLSKYKIPDQNTIPKSVIDKILNDKCIDGRPFMDLEKDIKVTIVY